MSFGLRLLEDPVKVFALQQILCGTAFRRRHLSVGGLSLFIRNDDLTGTGRTFDNSTCFASRNAHELIAVGTTKTNRHG